MSGAPGAASGVETRNGKPALVTGIRHWSTATYTRVAIDLGDNVTYEAARVPNPDRIYFDLHGTRLAPELVGKSFAVTDDGFLKKVRAAQYTDDVTRVVLDVNDVTEYSAFLLPNPYRLIIDIHGGKKQGTVTPASQDRSPGTPTGNREQRGNEVARRRGGYLLDRTMLRYLGLALLVIASQRELSLGKIRPDALLQAFLLFAIAALLTHLANGRLRYAALMGVALGCAYLTKSFAFVFAFLCIIALALFRWIWLRHGLMRIVSAALIAFTCFAVVAGPYVAALSRQRHSFDFGDSGTLNYAWYVGGTEKMHLQPYQTGQFGSSEVDLKHPEKELMHTPLVLSYAEMPYGTYPDWFDTTYWNEQIKPHFSVRQDLPRATRDSVLMVRYLFNHPEALLLLALLVVLGARPELRWKPGRHVTNAFWLVPLLLGVAIWCIYAIVNTEERYVTVAYFCVILTLFAALRLPDAQSEADSPAARSSAANLRFAASALILLLALLATFESLRTVFEDRRQLSLVKSPGGWTSPTMVHVSEGLESLGVKPGDTVACIGHTACLNDPYWARLAGVRILTEIYDPETPVAVFLANLSNRDEVIATVRAQGAKVLVGDFDNARVSDSNPAFRNWQQLGDTTLYALPLR